MENKMNYWAAPCIIYKADTNSIKTDNIIADVCQVSRVGNPVPIYTVIL